jgi:hypothetical protein
VPKTKLTRKYNALVHFRPSAGSLKRAEAVIENNSPVLPVRYGRPAVGIGIAHAKPYALKEARLGSEVDRNIELVGVGSASPMLVVELRLAV